MEQCQYRDYSFMVCREGGTMSLLQYRKMIDLLEERKPCEIIELGCGQSTVIFEQYTERNGGRLVSIEDNSEYARKDTRVFKVVEPGKLKIGEKEYRRCNYYEGLEKFLVERGVRYDFVSVDGPIGYGFREMFEFGRVQLLDFVVLDLMKEKCTVQIHDAQRVNMRNTQKEFERILDEKGYSWTVQEFESGEKNPVLLRVYSIEKK